MAMLHDLMLRLLPENFCNAAEDAACHPQCSVRKRIGVSRLRLGHSFLTNFKQQPCCVHLALHLVVNPHAQGRT